MAVPCRNWRLFRCVFWSQCCAWRALSSPPSSLLLSPFSSLKVFPLRILIAVLCLKGEAYMCFVDAWISNKSHMSHAFNGSSAVWCFEGSDAIEIHDGITFDFYTGLPHIHYFLGMAKTIHFFVYGEHRVRYHLASYPGSVSLHGEEPGYEANTTCKKTLLAQYKQPICTQHRQINWQAAAWTKLNCTSHKGRWYTGGSEK